MSKQDYTPVNEFIARGVVETIGRSNFGGRHLVLKVRERRTELRLDLALERNIAKGITKKDRVVVQGYTRAYSYHNDALNKDSEVMYFVATKVTRDVPEITQRFGVKGMFYPEHLFRAFISGKVVKVKKNENSWAQITVQTAGGGEDLRPSNVVIRYWLGGRLPLCDYEEGDIVCARCSAYSPTKKLSNGTTRTYQNLVAEDMAYIKKQHEKEEGPVLNTMDLGLPQTTTMSDEELDALEAAQIAENADAFADDSDLLAESM